MMKNVLDGLRDVVSNNYDGHLSIHECVSINNAISALYEWSSVFGFLGTADECGNEWIALKDENEQLRAKVAELDAQLAKYQNLEPACWMTPDGEGWRMRTKPPENDVPLGWMPLYALEK